LIALDTLFDHHQVVALSGYSRWLQCTSFTPPRSQQRIHPFVAISFTALFDIHRAFSLSLQKRVFSHPLVVVFLIIHVVR
jgi:hypothetical protein